MILYQKLANGEIIACIEPCESSILFCIVFMDLFRLCSNKQKHWSFFAALISSAFSSSSDSSSEPEASFWPPSLWKVTSSPTWWTKRRGANWADGARNTHQNLRYNPRPHGHRFGVSPHPRWSHRLLPHKWHSTSWAFCCTCLSLLAWLNTNIVEQTPMASFQKPTDCFEVNAKVKNVEKDTRFGFKIVWGYWSSHIIPWNCKREAWSSDHCQVSRSTQRRSWCMNLAGNAATNKLMFYRLYKCRLEKTSRAISVAVLVLSWSL